MKTIHHVVDMDAPASAIWSAITEESGLAGWWSSSVRAPGAERGARVAFTFTGDFSPVMEIASVEPETELEWRCVGGHEP